jgi:ankyrin repeat protein
LVTFSFSLDDQGFDERIRKDVKDYISRRLVADEGILTSAWNYEETPEVALTTFLTQISRGSFLYAKMVLDLLERRQLVIKSPSFSVIPQTLSEIFQLELNLIFPSSNSFSNARLFLSICLATLRPMSLRDIYHCVLQQEEEAISWEAFIQTYYTESVRRFMPQNGDTVTFFHGCFRDWLLSRRTMKTGGDRFSVDPRPGHEAIAVFLSRKGETLTEVETLDLAHHVLKAQLFRLSAGKGRNLTNKELEATWIAHTGADATRALASFKNFSTANSAICRILLLAGADPSSTVTTETHIKRPLIHVFAEKNNVDLVKLLVEFGAPLDSIDGEGFTALMIAAKLNLTEMISLLLSTTAGQASLGQSSNDGGTAISLAARNGSIKALQLVLSHDWPPFGGVHRTYAVQEALVCAASNDQLAALKVLIEEGGARVNEVSPMSGRLALSKAIETGARQCSRALLDAGADLAIVDSPLHLAIKRGHWNIVEMILIKSPNADSLLAVMDDRGLDPLSCAAAHGELATMELLLIHGSMASGHADLARLSPLSWACVEGREESVVHLLKREDVDVNRRDGDNGRTALHHALSSILADDKRICRQRIVRRLIEHGADIEAIDKQGFRPVDRAVEAAAVECINCLLKKGAKLGPTTWALAKANEQVM